MQGSANIFTFPRQPNAEKPLHFTSVSSQLAVNHIFSRSRDMEYSVTLLFYSTTTLLSRHCSPGPLSLSRLLLPFSAVFFRGRQTNVSFEAYSFISKLPVAN